MSECQHVHQTHAVDLDAGRDRDCGVPLPFFRASKRNVNYILVLGGEVAVRALAACSAFARVRQFPIVTAPTTKLTRHFRALKVWVQGNQGSIISLQDEVPHIFFLPNLLVSLFSGEMPLVVIHATFLNHAANQAATAVRVTRAMRSWRAE